MKSIKRILAIVMIMAMMFSLVAINASAENIASGIVGGCKWTIAADGTLTIEPGTATAECAAGQLPDDEDSWGWKEDYAYRSSIKKAVVASGVIAGDSLRCMFEGCNKMESADLSGLDTSNVEDMMNMFYNCSELKSLDLSTFDTSNATKMKCMFDSCLKLESLDLSSFDTSNVTDMCGMFAFCQNLESIDLSTFDTSNVKNMESMFFLDPSVDVHLKTIYVGDNWSTEKVTNSNNMFAYCTELVGGNGTTYDANYIDATYARGDAGSAAPGYFTKLYTISQTADELTWEKGCCDVLTVTSSATYKTTFANKIIVDDVEVAEQDSSKDYKNYSIMSGSTKVLLSAGYLETLSVGKHSIEIVSEDGYAKGTFTIVEAAKTEEPTTKKEETKVVEEEKVVDTADTSAIGAFVALSAFAAAGYASLKKRED